MPKLEFVVFVLVHCNLVNSNYQQTSKVLFTFVPNIQSINHYCTSFINNAKQQIQNFHPLKYDLLIKIASNLQ